MPFETERWTYVPAKYVGAKRTVPVRLVVIHTAETKESTVSAENLAKYGQHPDYPSSWHVAVDSDSVIQCVQDSYVAYAAPGANHDGIQIELACFMGQTAGEWRDPYSLALVALAADVAAQYALKYDIPVRHLTDGQLLAGEAGIVGHDQVSRVYKKSTHTDPGPNFPWPRFMGIAGLMAFERHAA